MSFGDLIGDISQDGFNQGLQNYIGNDTGFGQAINSLYGLTQPKGNTNQLIGDRPEPYNNPYRLDESHYGDAKDGSNWRPINNRGQSAMATWGQKSVPVSSAQYPVQDNFKDPGTLQSPNMVDMTGNNENQLTPIKGGSAGKLMSVLEMVAD